MKVVFTAKFSKDLDKLTVKSVKIKLLAVIDEIERANSIADLTNVNKIVGENNAYRIRIGDYRLGFYYHQNTITLARFSHRRDIYRYFP